jgi:glycosyltransferase involved in cell wall biosynthesis
VKILVLSNLYPPAFVGGYEILCQQVCSALSERGHEVSVLTTDSGAAGASRSPGEASPAEGSGIVRELELLAPFGAQAPRSRARRWSVGRRNAVTARQTIRTLQPDLVFVWSQLRMTLGAARACERSGVTTCYTMNDPHLAGYSPRALTLALRGLAGGLLDRGPLRSDTTRGLRLDHVTCISGVVVEDLEAGGVGLRSPRVIHQGIPIDRFPLKPEPGLLHDPVRLLYAGQLLDYKGPDVLLRAAKRLAERDGRAPEVSIVGDGPMRSRLQSLARDLGVPTNFAGSVSHALMPEIYRSHDVLAFTSTWREPFGLTHLEAMASGTPVVSTAVGGQAEFLRDGENALLVPPGDDAALADAIHSVTQSPSMASRLGLAGRKTVERAYTLDRYVDDLEGWLHEVHSGGRR